MCRPNYISDLEASKKWIDTLAECGCDVTPEETTTCKAENAEIVIHSYKISIQGLVLHVSLNCIKREGHLENRVWICFNRTAPFLGPVAEHLLLALSACAKGKALYTDDFYVSSHDNRETLKQFFEGSLMLSPCFSISSKEAPLRVVADYYDDPSGLRFFLGNIDGVCYVAIKQSVCFWPSSKRKQKEVLGLVLQTLHRCGFVKNEKILDKSRLTPT